MHVEAPDASASELMLGLGMNMSPNVNMGGKKVLQQQRKLKLKKYKNNAEKVLSLFSSPKGGQGQGPGGVGQLSNSNFLPQAGGSTFVPGQSISNAQEGGVEAAQSQLGQGQQC